jgi:hypothetical protein
MRRYFSYRIDLKKSSIYGLNTGATAADLKSSSRFLYDEENPNNNCQDITLHYIKTFKTRLLPKKNFQKRARHKLIRRKIKSSLKQMYFEASFKYGNAGCKAHRIWEAGPACKNARSPNLV